MKVTAIKTKKVELGDDLFDVIDEYLPKLHEKDVVVIVSKIIAICQGDVIKNDGTHTKVDVIRKEADLYLPEEYTMHGITLSIKNSTLGSGVDESNGHGYFVLWPKNLQETTNKIWKYLREKHGVMNLGIVVTDGRIVPLRKGVTGIALSWCGFEPLRDYIGKPDIFGKNLLVTKASVIDGIAAASTLETGEGNEQTPLAVVSEISNINFVDRTPNKEELEEMSIDIDYDVFAKVLGSVNWIKGGSGR